LGRRLDRLDLGSGVAFGRRFGFVDGGFALRNVPLGNIGVEPSRAVRTLLVVLGGIIELGRRCDFSKVASFLFNSVHLFGVAH